MDEQNRHAEPSEERPSGNDNLTALLADHQLHQSNLQLAAFVVAGHGGTPYGCYKQALREVYKRSRGLSAMRSDRELLCIDIEEMEFRKDGNPFARRRRAVHLEAKRRGLDELDRNIADTQREYDQLKGHAERLKPLVGELTDQRRDELDCEMWVHLLRMQAAVDYITTGRLKASTVHLIHSLPDGMRLMLCREVIPEDGPQSLIDWYLAYDPQLPRLTVSKAG